LATKK
jgi:predicted flavoprotein YhiN